MTPSPGLHHATAVATDERTTIAFYRGLLGLRLVKRTVAYVDSMCPHLYFGNDQARPGSIVTFFIRPPEATGAPRCGGLILAVAPGTLSRWAARLTEAGAPSVRTIEVLGEPALHALDPDGLSLELLERPHAGSHLRAALLGVRLDTADAPGLADLLRRRLGFDDHRPGAARRRLAPTGDRPDPSLIDIAPCDRPPPRDPGAGSLHHAAFRAADSAHQSALAAALTNDGLRPTEVFDRTYFRSAYFYEPGGVKLEIATDGPGFTVDEPAAELGSRVCLPPHLESRRAEIESR